MDWLPWGDGFQGLQFWYGLAQAPTPNAPSPTQVDLLRQQLEFLTRENARQTAEFTEKLRLVAAENQELSQSFTTFVNTMRDSVQFAGLAIAGVTAIVGFAFIFLFNRSIREAKELAVASVTRQVEQKMADVADNRIELVRRSLERESVIDRAEVEYWLLGAQSPPREFELLEMRGFNVRFCSQIQPGRRRSVDVIVLDLNNWRDSQNHKFGELSRQEQEQQVKRQFDWVRDSMAGTAAVFVVYVAGRFDYLDEQGRDRLIAPTNNTVTLVGTVVDAAYLVAGDR